MMMGMMFRSAKPDGFGGTGWTQHAKEARQDATWPAINPGA
jgi:hypothetical protein